MKKVFFLFLCLAFLSSSTQIRASENPPLPQETQQTAPQEAETPKEIPWSSSPKEVGRASNEGVKAAKTRNWQNWLFAGTSVAIAVVALILLSDSGHSPHHND
jgi:hypothetical protein